MPEDSKKHQHKHHSEPKEQRKPKQGRHQAAGDKRNEKPQAVASKHEPKAQSKLPVPQEPGPEFYEGLKRETDEILKITEEANAKYKKKEIQSNWSKYEMPIESYDEIDEQENLGADFEKLAAAPLSVGSHFQFKHEKSWDISTEPSLYDKYFNFDMENLALAISTIPFHERNDLNKSLFTESDLLSMDHRSIKYKQQYFKDKSFTTHDLEAMEQICKLIIEDTDDISEINQSETNETVLEEINNLQKVTEEISLVNESNKLPKEVLDTKSTVATEIIMEPVSKEIDIDDLLLGSVASIATAETCDNVKADNATSKESEMETPKNTVIESPEELEKWLDDFLES